MENGQLCHLFAGLSEQQIATCSLVCEESLHPTRTARVPHQIVIQTVWASRETIDPPSAVRSKFRTDHHVPAMKNSTGSHPSWLAKYWSHDLRPRISIWKEISSSTFVLLGCWSYKELHRLSATRWRNGAVCNPLCLSGLWPHWRCRQMRIDLQVPWRMWSVTLASWRLGGPQV